MKKINEVVELIEKMGKEEQKRIANLLKNVISEKKCTTEKLYNLGDLLGYSIPRLYQRMSVKQISEQNLDFKLWLSNVRKVCIDTLKILTGKNIIDEIKAEKSDIKRAFSVIGKGQSELISVAQLKVQMAQKDDDFEFEKLIKKEKIIKEAIKNLQNKIDDANDQIELELKSELSWLYE